MKPNLLVLALSLTLVFSSSMNKLTASGSHLIPEKSSTNFIESYNYSFKVSGIDNFGYKPFIDLLEETFLKRPVYNSETGRFHNADGLFEIIGSSINITESSFSAKLSEIGISLTYFNGSVVNTTNNTQNQ